MAWFYTEVGGLTRCEPDGLTDTQLCFKSALLWLWVRFVDDPQVDPVARRLTLRIPSLEGTADLLEDRGVAYHYVAGLSYTDRRLVVHDPAGHRLELRREWPAM